MHLVKWFRKNMTKLMAIFVILIMVAFVMPSLLNQLAKPRMGGAGSAMWLYGKDKEITINDIRQATAELAVLRGLYVNEFLIRQQDLRLIFLGRLLFPEPDGAARLSDAIKNVSFRSQFYISFSKIDDFFAQTRGRSELFWILLKSEAKRAGCAVFPEQAGEILSRLISQVTNNQMDAATAVNRICSANNMTDQQGLAAFADVLSIIIYSKVVSDVENVTEPQLENVFARLKEKINAEFVPFRAEDFLIKVSEPDETQITAQFEKYKNYLPGEIADDNPYGFGYKFGPRVSLDYIIVKLEDVKKLVAMPTEEDAENYYQLHLDEFTQQVATDANDPNSGTVVRQRSYAEVAAIIKDILYTQKVRSQSMKILGRAVEQAEADFESLDFEKASTEEFKSKAGDYGTSAQVASKEYNIKIYTGRTALLSAGEIQSNKYLGSLLMAGRSRIPVGFARLVFAVKELGDEASKLGPFDTPMPKMYVSVGPLTDAAGSIAAMVRVVETANSAASESIGLNYQKNLPEIAESAETEEKTFVLRDVVAKDCKRFEAMKIARKTAEEFLGTAKKQSWDAALQKVNASYGKKDDTKTDKKTFEMQTWNDRNRVLQTDIEMTKMKVSDMPGTKNVINESIIYAGLVDVFYKQFENMQVTKEELPVIIEFKPRLSCYAVKSLTCASGTTGEYEQIRQQLAFQQDYVDSQSIAIEHFMPDNILKRLNLRPAQPVQEPNKPAGPNNLNGENQ